MSRKISRPRTWSTSSKRSKPVSARTSVPADARRLLEEYCHIEPANVRRHMDATHSQALYLSYSSLSRYRPFTSTLDDNPFLTKLIKHLRLSASFLAIDCGAGQDLRYLIHRYNVSPAQLFGVERDARLIELGMACFGDASNLGANIICTDMHDDSPEAAFDGSSASRLAGRFDIIYSAESAASWTDQVCASARLARFLAKPSPGGEPPMVIGRLAVHHLPGECSADPNDDNETIKHSSEHHIRALWQEVSRLTSCEFAVDVALDGATSPGDGDGGGGMDASPYVSYCATRIR